MSRRRRISRASWEVMGLTSPDSLCVRAPGGLESHDWGRLPLQISLYVAG